MAHIAIVHLPDDHTAARFVARMETTPLDAQLVGVFQYPARRELADHPNCSINGKAAWSRSPMGFMRCAVCGKRNKRVRQFLTASLFDFLGANLYPKAPGAFRTPDGYGNPANNG